DFGDRPVAAVLVVDGPEIVGVVARIVGQGQYLAGAGVERHGAAAAAAHVLDRSRDDLLGLPLQVTVDRQHQIAAVDGVGGLPLAGGDALAPGAALVLGLAVGAAQGVVEGQLGARQGGAVVADEAQDVPAHGARRVDPVGDGVCADPGDLQGQGGVADGGLDVLEQVHEAAV